MHTTCTQAAAAPNALMTYKTELYLEFIGNVYSEVHISQTSLIPSKAPPVANYRD